jgi:hypothetical protein
LIPVGKINLYIDEDAMDSDLVAALRSRGVTVITAFNVCDFFQLHTEWIVAGRDHSGMILARQQRLSIGEQLRRILRLLSNTTAVEMRNHVEFLGNRS